MKENQLKAKVKISDLRIGNNINGIYIFEDEDENDEIIEIEKTTFCTVVSLDTTESTYHPIMVESDDNIESFERMEGIPLSEDILVKLGFEKFSSTPYFLNYKNEKGFGISQWLSKEPVAGFEKTGSWYHGDDFIEIKSVHHLQNYYHARTGEELTFKK